MKFSIILKFWLENNAKFKFWLENTKPSKIIRKEFLYSEEIRFEFEKWALQLRLFESKG